MVVPTCSPAAPRRMPLSERGNSSRTSTNASRSGHQREIEVPLLVAEVHLLMAGSSRLEAIEPGPDMLAKVQSTAEAVAVVVGRTWISATARNGGAAATERQVQGLRSDT